MKQQIMEIVQRCLEEFNEDQERRLPLELGAAAPLYSKDGCLDSIGLVTVLVSIEQALEERLSRVVSLTDEAGALSQKDSPFKSVGSLVDYVHSLLQWKSAEESAALHTGG